MITARRAAEYQAKCGAWGGRKTRPDGAASAEQPLRTASPQKNYVCTKRAGGGKTILLNTHYSLTYPGKSTLGEQRLNLMRGAARVRVTYRQELNFEGNPLVSWKARTQSKSKSEVLPKR